MEMQRKIIILIIISSVILFGSNLYGQVAENVTAVNCPEEKTEVHVSQESLFTGELLWFKVYCTSALFPQEELSSLAFVELVNSDNASVLRKKILLKHGEGSGEFEIPENLPTGLYYILAYTNWMKNFGEASFFRKELIIINPYQPNNKAQDRTDSVKTKKITTSQVYSSKSLKIELDRNTYSTRQPVALKVEASNRSGKAINSFSVSVCRREPQMIFNSERGYSGTLSNPPKEMTYLPDYNGIRLTGKLSDASDNGIADAYIIESCIGKGTDIKRSRTDSGGNFNFLLKPKEGEQEIVFTMPVEGAKITLEESFWNGFRNSPVNRSLILNNEAVSYLKGKFNHFQLQSRFKKQNFLKTAAEKTAEDSTVFYSNPYQLIKLKDYVTLDSLREYFYELVPSVKFSRREGGLDISVRDSVNQSSFEDKPGVFLDGVYYDNYAEFVSIPVREVDRIAILPKTYYYKDFTFGGIIDIHTSKSDFNRVKPTAKMTRIIFPMAETSEVKFTSPDYSISGSTDRTPDFRYLLYWNPYVKPDTMGNAAIKFYTGDVKGIFVVKITGLSEDGSILQAEQEIVVE
jgi:hypothetical protein